MFSRKCDFCITLPYNAKNTREMAHKRGHALIVIVRCWPRCTCDKAESKIKESVKMLH